MKTVRLGELLDRLVGSFSEAMHPGVGTSDRLDQRIVARSFRYTVSFYRGCSIFCLDSPRNSYFRGAATAGGTSGGYQQSITGNDDALKRFDGGARTFRIPVVSMRFEGGKHRALDFCRGDTSDGSRCCLPSPQPRPADIEALTHAVVAGKAWAHEIAAVVVDLSQEQCPALGS